jgi:asparagine synthase (glutamine-hydrolysing)
MADQLAVPENFDSWSDLAKAQFIEVRTFLSSYLLSSQGDRVSMANSVEARFPFLDHRVIEFCNRLPTHLKLRGLQDKRLLRRLGREFLPENIWRRPKKPYRAPIHKSFFNQKSPAYVHELLSEKAIRASGYFNPQAVTKLVQKIQRGATIGETDDMAIVGILSTQLLHHQFVHSFVKSTDTLKADNVKVCDRRTLSCEP